MFLAKYKTTDNLAVKPRWTPTFYRATKNSNNNESKNNNNNNNNDNNQPGCDFVTVSQGELQPFPVQQQKTTTTIYLAVILSLSAQGISNILPCNNNSDTNESSYNKNPNNYNNLPYCDTRKPKQSPTFSLATTTTKATTTTTTPTTIYLAVILSPSAQVNSNRRPFTSACRRRE